jgi:hypothetical protein
LRTKSAVDLALDLSQPVVLFEAGATDKDLAVDNHDDMAATAHNDIAMRGQASITIFS